MNEIILNEWIRQGRIQVSDSEYPFVLFFVKYFDKSSLRLQNIEKDLFTFTNDAQNITLTLSEVLDYSSKLKQGIHFPWTQYDK